VQQNQHDKSIYGFQGGTDPADLPDGICSSTNRTGYRECSAAVYDRHAAGNSTSNIGAGSATDLSRTPVFWLAPTRNDHG
jgi:hypothetical protein